ncbi:MAG: ABC transporter substrate-binding protein [Pseudomonadota bacterium]
MTNRNRRQVSLGLASAFGFAASGAGCSPPKSEALTIWGPPAGPSITLVHAIESDLLGAVGDAIQFKAWRNPHELRAGLTSGTIDLFIAPTQTAANLYNRGLGVRLVNVMTNGLLYVVSADPSISTIADLKGKKASVPFRNDTPDIVFKRLLSLNGLSLETDLSVEFTGTPIEAVQLLTAGRIDAAVVPEPAASAAILRAGVAGKTVSRVIDIQKAWADATDASASLPQAGLGVTEAFLTANGPAIDALQNALEKAVASVNADPATAANDAAAVLSMPWPVLEKSIPFSNLVATPARDARPALEAMFTVIAEADADAIGGNLPDTDFYL